jgi:hypothetical protein
MIFWIFVILAIGGLVTFIAFSGASKEDKEFKRLEEEYEYESRKTVWTPFDSRMEAYNRQLERKNAAYDRLQEFNKAHPNRKEKARHKECISNIGGGFLIGAGVVCILMLMAMMFIYLSASAEKAKLEAEYEVLSWEVENDVYTDNGDDVVGKKELYNHVREWNKSLATKQAGERNFWYGIFVPNIYGDLKPIELK